MDEPYGLDPLTEFNGRLARTRRGIFLFDYDGTIAPFSIDTRDVRPYPGVGAALDALMEMDGVRVIIVTGRYVRVAPPMLGTSGNPEIWGSHGRERLLPDGRYEVARIDERAVDGLIRADAWSAEVDELGGRCEAKPGGLAVHWRGASPDDIARIRDFVDQRFHRDALGDVLEMRPFDGGVELRAPGIAKGDVVRTVLGEAGAGIPAAYLGDDLTDEDAFAALRNDDLRVLVRPEFRESGADLWIRPPEGLLWLLGLWCDTVRPAASAGKGA